MSVNIVSGATTDLLTVDPVSKAARVWLYDPAGNPIDSVIEGSDHYLGVAIRQDVHPSPDNSSAANINSGAYFTGVGVSSLGIGSIQVNTYIDQPHTVYVEQSADNVNWYIVDEWPVPASTGISRPVTAMDNYLRIRVLNTGSAPSTITSINTALCPVSETLPRSLTSGGNLKVTPTAEWQDNRLVIGLYQVSTFLTIGSGASPQNIFALNNPAPPTSKRNIALRQLSVSSDSTAVLTAVSPRAIFSRPAALATNGTVLTPVKFRTSYAAPVGVPIGATNADSAALTAITAVAGSSIWTQFLDRPHTLVGWFPHTAYSMLPDVGTDLRQNLLIPGESALIQIVGSAAATTQMIVNCSWLEYLAY